uniref:Putative secreted protein n=1 Tax=Anopheles darlingi TaxID=43151 RepID=A0A2M4DRA4_ANODA
MHRACATTLTGLAVASLAKVCPSGATEMSDAVPAQGVRCPNRVTMRTIDHPSIHPGTGADTGFKCAEPAPHGDCVNARSLYDLCPHTVSYTPSKVWWK